MMLDLVRALGQGFMDYFGSNTLVSKMEISFEKMKGEIRELMKEYLKKSQKMFIDGLMIAVVLGIGFFYLTDGLSKIIEFYSSVPGIGRVVMGGLLLLVGLWFLKTSQKNIEA